MMTMMIVRMFKVMPPPFDRGDVEEEYEEDDNTNHEDLQHNGQELEL